MSDSSVVSMLAVGDLDLVWSDWAESAEWVLTSPGFVPGSGLLDPETERQPTTFVPLVAPAVLSRTAGERHAAERLEGLVRLADWPTVPPGAVLSLAWRGDQFQVIDRMELVGGRLLQLQLHRHLAD